MFAMTVLIGPLDGCSRKSILGRSHLASYHLSLSTERTLLLRASPVSPCQRMLFHLQLPSSSTTNIFFCP